MAVSTLSGRLLLAIHRHYITWAIAAFYRVISAITEILCRRQHSTSNTPSSNFSSMTAVLNTNVSPVVLGPMFYGIVISVTRHQALQQFRLHYLEFYLIVYLSQKEIPQT